MVNTLSPPSLFAGKLHAVIARTFLNRVKGRDYYDLVFFMGKKIPVNLKYLEAKLKDSGHIASDTMLKRDHLIELLIEKFARVDFEKAKEDVLPFLSASSYEGVKGWTRELFVEIVKEIVVE